MINLHKQMLLDLVGIKPSTSWSQFDNVSNWAQHIWDTSGDIQMDLSSQSSYLFC